MKRLTLLPLLCTIALVGCEVQKKPIINFIGISSGTLVTDLDNLQFSERYTVNDTNLVGVVAFDHVLDGTSVQATWFSPDDRRMPLGRTNIVTESGAKIARFSFARGIPWDKAPYMLQVRAWHENDQQQSASGSTQFYIGMNDEEIEQYHEAYALWEEEKERQRLEREAAEAAAAAASGANLSGDTLEPSAEI